MPTHTTPTQRDMIAATAFIAAPIFMLTYGVIRLLGGHPGPGPGWTIGHLAFLIALFLFGLVLLGLRRLAQSRRRGLQVAADLATAAGFLGLVAMIIQISVDLFVGMASADHAEMSRMFDNFQSWPGVTPAIYTIVPQLLFVGLIALGVLAALTRRMHPLGVILMIAGTALAAVNLDLLPAAALCYLLALVPPAIGFTRPTNADHDTRETIR